MMIKFVDRDGNRWNYEKEDLIRYAMFPLNMAFPSGVSKKLWSKAKGCCSICKKQLIVVDDDVEIVVGQEAHIQSEAENGPRHYPVPKSGIYNNYENGVLLCYECHRKIDNNIEKWTVIRIKEIKQKHEKEVSMGNIDIIDDHRNLAVLTKHRIYNYIYEQTSENYASISGQDRLYISVDEIVNELDIPTSEVKDACDGDGRLRRMEDSYPPRYGIVYIVDGYRYFEQQIQSGNIKEGVFDPD